jgi:hypothetical protein
MGNYLPNYLTKAMLRPWRQVLVSIQSRDAEAKPSQSQFEAGKPLRRRCCQTVSESSRHPFQVSCFVYGSRDLGEHDQISLEAIRHCNYVPLSFRIEIEKPPSQRKGPET